MNEYIVIVSIIILIFSCIGKHSSDAQKATATVIINGIKTVCNMRKGFVCFRIRFNTGSNNSDWIWA